MSEIKFPKLTIFSEKGKGTEFELKKPKYICGRIETNDIILDDISVSSNHCELVKRGTTFLIRDLDSTNGVVVNEVSVNEKVLNDNDIVKIGTIELLYVTNIVSEDKKVPENQVKAKVKTGINLDAFEENALSGGKTKDIFPYTDTKSKDLKNRLPLFVITTVIVLLALVVLGLFAWFFTVFIL